MTAFQRGVPALPCAICGTPMHLPGVCAQIHADHCHPCYQRNLASGFDAREHRGPEESFVLAPRDVAALAAYTQHVQRVVGTEALRHLLLEDEA